MTRRGLLIGSALLLAAVGVPLAVVGPPSVPAEAIQSSVIRSPDLLARAWRTPVAATYQGRIAWQSNRSMCGPASLANVFRSFGDAPISEAAVLAGTGRCRTGFCILGLTLDELADVARLRTRRKVMVLRNLTAEQFREELRRANDPRRRYVVNFSRAPIFGAGGGHHSPIGGYLEDRDLVLVLDVNRDFRPWLIERRRLFAAMDTLDGDRKRGLLRIE